MKYTEEIYKRKRRGKTVYDGVLTYYDEDGTTPNQNMSTKFLCFVRVVAFDIRKE